MIKLSSNRNKKRLSVGAFFILAAFAYLNLQPPQTSHSELASLYVNKHSGQMVEFEGQVLRILADDNEGSRHQRFIVKSDELTVLIAHNIDLAKRVPVNIGDQVNIYGQYEYNTQGGVIHWTHYDPQGKHTGGWIKHKNKKYGIGFKK